MAKQYFYKDSSGKLQKFYYCIRGCPEPYKEEDIGKKDKITKVTDHVHVCHKCLKTFEINEFKRVNKKVSKAKSKEVVEDLEDEEALPR